MSRSDYSDNIDNWDLIRWRGQVASSIRGKRGQQLIKELIEALDAMPVKRLITGELKSSDGEVCALGALGTKRQIDLSKLDPGDSTTVAETFNIAEQLAKEIAYLNDEACEYKTPEDRWKYMREWAQSKLVRTI